MDAAHIKDLLIQYQQPFIFLGTFFFGETVVLMAAYLSVVMGWSPLNVFLLCLMGTALSDTGWFMLGRYFSGAVSRSDSFKDKLPRLKKFLSEMAGNPRTLLLYYKFIYGMRVMTIIYLASQRTRIRNFLMYNGLGTVIWLTIIIGVGWLAGEGVVGLTAFPGTMEMGLVFLAIFLLTRRMAKRWIYRQTEQA